jgi:hypothetical protein
MSASTSSDVSWRELEAPLADVLQAVGTSGASSKEQHLTAAGPCRGKNYAGDLLLVGRAVNGWDSGWPRTEAAEREWCVAQARTLLKNGWSENGKCSLGWVVEDRGHDRSPEGSPTYNTNRSPFWQLARRTLESLRVVAPDEPSWSSALAWTNLYPVAPSDGGNPSESLCKGQFKTAAEFLKAQFRVLMPARSLWVTDVEWARPFLTAMGTTAGYENPSDPYVQWIGTVPAGDRQCRLVVCKRPEAVAREPMVEAVARGFGG